MEVYGIEKHVNGVKELVFRVALKTRDIVVLKLKQDKCAEDETL